MRVRAAVPTRHAIKWDEPAHKMPEDTIRTLMEHAILAAAQDEA